MAVTVTVLVIVSSAPRLGLSSMPVEVEAPAVVVLVDPLSSETLFGLSSALAAPVAVAEAEVVLSSLPLSGNALRLTTPVPVGKMIEVVPLPAVGKPGAVGSAPVGYGTVVEQSLSSLPPWPLPRPGLIGRRGLSSSPSWCFGSLSSPLLVGRAKAEARAM